MHRNETIARSFASSLGRGDVNAIMELLDPRVIWHLPGETLVSGDFTCAEEVVRHFGDVMNPTAGTFRVELHDSIANDDHAVNIAVGRGERARKPFELRSIVLFHIRDGKITEVWQTFQDFALFQDVFAKEAGD